MRHGVIRAGQTSWDAAEQNRWKQDAMPELHNDNALSLGARGGVPDRYTASTLQGNG